MHEIEWERGRKGNRGYGAQHWYALNAMFFSKPFMCGIVGRHFNVACLYHQFLMSADGKIRREVSTRCSSRNAVSSQGYIVCARTEVNTFDVAYSTRTDTVLPLHAHNQSHSGNVAKCQDEIGVK